jgi:predicted nucleic acid-binding protein
VSFLIDTDICSLYLKRPSQLAAKFQQYYGRLHLSAITVGEIRAWTLRRNTPPSRVNDLDNLLRVVDVVAVDQAVADRFGALRAAQLDSGTQTPRLDLLIGATALVHNLTLVTHNVKDYVYVPGLSIIDWLGP